MPGRATFYEADQSPGNCSFGTPDWPFTVALPTWAYDGGRPCGAFVELSSVGATGVSSPGTCTDNTTVIAMVTDQCPEASNPQWCGPSQNGVMHFDLSDNTFDELFVPACGAVQGFGWRWVERPDNSTISIASSSGSNPYWFSFTVRAHRYALVAAEVRDASPNAMWLSLPRASWNEWIAQNNSGWVAPLSIRLTDVHGQQVTLTDVVTSVAPSTVFTSTVQFPAGRGGGNPLSP